MYVVATPIGNLRDLTLRSMDVLAEVDWIAAEDTRRTRVLLAHLNLRGKAILRLDTHAHADRVGRVVERLENGESGALVTDAGMPCISDPGAALVRAASERGLSVVAVPGPSALTAAVAVSGLVAGSFWFVGFPPRKGPERRALVTRIAGTQEPVVLFEAPGRTGSVLRELAELMPEREASVSRELTKAFEETRRGTVTELAQCADWRGEVTIVLGRWAGKATRPERTAYDIDRAIDDRLARGESAKSIARCLAHETGLSRRGLYARVHRTTDKAAYTDDESDPPLGGGAVWLG
ncbi:16S rRNA (cytidine(1402)-2'-O)-methyltransferase [Myxococcota bacterium]